MNRFRLNLIRDQVPSVVQRRVRFRTLLIYLALAGLVLVVAVGMASSRVSQAWEHRAQSQRLEKAYAKSHNERSGIQPGAARLQARLATQVTALRAVGERLSSDPRPARFLRALALSLPPNMALYKVSMNAEEHTIAFEVRVFAPAADSSFGAPELMNLWQQDPAISGEITQLAYVGSQAEKSGANGNTLLQFSGRLEKGRP